MKKLSKTLLAIAAVSAASMAMTASAMAMTADYANGVVTLSGIEDTGASQTLLIVPEGTETATEENIYQIDQKDAVDGVNGSFNGKEIKLDVSKLTEGATYEVRIGGTTAGTIQSTTFTVGAVEPGNITIVIGDVDDDKKATSSDAAKIASAEVGMTAEGYNDAVGAEYTVVSGIDAETVKIGDVDLDNNATSTDAAKIASFEVGNVAQGYNDLVSTEIQVQAKAE